MLLHEDVPVVTKHHPDPSILKDRDTNPVTLNYTNGLIPDNCYAPSFQRSDLVGDGLF